MTSYNFYNCFYLEAFEHCLVFTEGIILIHLFLLQIFLPLVTIVENLTPMSFGVSLSMDTLLSFAFCHSDMKKIYGQIISNCLHFCMGVSCIICAHAPIFNSICKSFKVCYHVSLPLHNPLKFVCNNMN